MNPGELDRYIELYKEGVATGTYNNNEPVHTDSAHGNRWAKFEQVGITETYKADMLVLETRAKFTIRFERINETYKIKYDNKWYDIEGITPIGRREYIEIECVSTSKTSFKT